MLIELIEKSYSNALWVCQDSTTLRISNALFLFSNLDSSEEATA